MAYPVRRLRILVSAYACDPYAGSEGGVGWRSVCRIAQNHDVFVLTNPHNMEGWQRAAQNGMIPEGVCVRYVQGGTACSGNRFIARFQSWLNYASFQRKVLEEAVRWHAEMNFDICHQVTIAAWRMPSPLWKLPIPFIWGPIGGAGHIPREFRPMLSPAARVFELARDINTWWVVRQNPFHQCMEHAAVIFTANQETFDFLKPFRKGMPMVCLPIVSFPADVLERFRRPADKWLGHPVPASSPAPPLRIFAGGNMEGRKGVALALMALALVKQAGVEFHYTIAGGGPDIPHLKKLAQRLGVHGQVEFNLGYQGDDYVRALWQSDVYLLPSFRESTPVTLLEAMLAGCYPVVADTSAQGEIVRLAGGTPVPTHSMEGLIQGLADAIIWCARHRADMDRLAKSAAKSVAEHFSSERYDRTLEEAYRHALGHGTPEPAPATQSNP